MDRWDQAEATLTGLADDELAVGRRPAPTLLAHAGDEPLALVTIRPTAPGELIGALTELLALLLPLGADRVCLAVAGRSWSLDDPTGGAVDGIDVRPSVLVVTSVDGHRRTPPTVTSTVTPFGRGEDGSLRRHAATDVVDRVVRGDDDVPAGRRGAWSGDDLGGPVAAALSCLIAGRHEVDLGPPAQTAVQFARCLLRGHAIVLGPDAAARLEASTAVAHPT